MRRSSASFGVSRRNVLRALATAACATLPGTRAVSQTGPRWVVTGERLASLDAIDQAIQQAMQAANVRVGAIAVACMGKSLFEPGYPWAERDYPVTQPGSLFRHASVSKLFGVALTYELVKAGALKLDTRVFPFLDLYHFARKRRAIDPRLNDITV